MRRFLPWVALGVVVFVVLAWAAWPDGGTATPREQARDLATELRCPDCEGLSVADSSTSSARAIRNDLRRRFDAGATAEQVRQVYIDRYGESILLKPEGDGLGILVWGLPAVVLVLGAGGLAIAFARWRRVPQLHASAADEALVDELRRRDDA